ncbi:MAG: hypothetical protein AAF805_09205 [Planctomycetota bacterium]
MFDYFEGEDRAHRERSKRWLDRQLQRNRDLADRRVEVDRAILRAQLAGDREELARLETQRAKLSQQASAQAATAIGLLVGSVVLVVAVVFFL